MIAAAWDYAENGAPPPREWQLLNLIREFGVPAIMRRDYLGAGEILRMRTVERLLHAHADRARSINWVVWARENPEDNALLMAALKASDNGG